MPRKRKEDVDRDLAEGKINKPHQRFAANARERSRMRVLSKAFSRLKTTLPWVPPDTKLSKLDTLRLASSYIAHLKQILDHEETAIHSGGTFIHPLNLTWPFTFSSRAFGSSPTSSPLPTSCNKTTHGNNFKIIQNHNTMANVFSKNNSNINNDDNCNNKTFHSGSFLTKFNQNNKDGINHMTSHLHSNHLTSLVNGGYNNEGLSPISDTSSINDN